MKKIPSLFFCTEDHVITEEVNPLCKWVIDGEGIATVKFDGSSCMVKDGKLYKRYDNSRLVGKAERIQKTAPLENWIHCGDTSERGQFLYWIPVSYKDYYHQIAWAWSQGKLEDGTYELIGPEVQDNLHGSPNNILVKHGSVLINLLSCDPRTFEEIKMHLMHCNYEGIVWHHPDGRMAKITKMKFGFPWGKR